MTTLQTVIIKKIIAVLKFPKSHPKFIIYAKAIYDAMKNNTLFSGSSATLLLLDTAITDLLKAQTGCKEKPPTYTTAQRNAFRVIVEDLLNKLRNDVQELADADKPNAEAIILAAAMSVKKITARSKQQNSAENGNEPGTVILKGAGKGAHEWRMRKGDGAWTKLDATLVATLTVTGLESKTLYYFQNRRILPKGVYGDWSQSFELLVN